MEIKIPFSTKSISLEKNSEELKYRAILSRDSLFYGLFDFGNRLLSHGRIEVDTIPKNAVLKEYRHRFDHSFVVFNNPIFSLSEHRNIDSEKLLKFSHSIHDIDKYIITKEEEVINDTDLCFAIPKPIIKALSKHLGECGYAHYQSILLASIDKKISSSIIYGSLLCGNLNLIYIENGKLQIANCYQVRNESDFYYYIALIFDQYKLVKGVTSIQLDGDFSEVNWDKSQFSNFFGTEPQIIISEYKTSETNPALVALTRLNKCASLEEV